MNKELALTPTNQLAITEAQFAVLTQATETGEVRYRRGKGGRQFPYTDPAYVIRTLNLAFGWDWDFEADNEEIFYANSKPFEAKVRGRLTVRNGGNVITKTQFGCQPIEYLKDSDTPVSLGDAYKGAASDALKKCASLLGVALDLYDSDSDINTGKQTRTVQVEPPKTTEGVKPAPSTGSGHGNGKKLAADAMTQFWLAIKEAELSTAEGQRILSSVSGDAVKAIDALQGISQQQPT